MGTGVGLAEEGAAVGLKVGVVGLTVGLTVGVAVVGLAEGDNEGLGEGMGVGILVVGRAVGVAVAAISGIKTKKIAKKKSTDANITTESCLVNVKCQLRLPSFFNFFFSNDLISVSEYIKSPPPPRPLFSSYVKVRLLLLLLNFSPFWEEKSRVRLPKIKRENCIYKVKIKMDAIRR